MHRADLKTTERQMQSLPTAVQETGTYTQKTAACRANLSRGQADRHNNRQACNMTTRGWRQASMAGKQRN